MGWSERIMETFRGERNSVIVVFALSFVFEVIWFSVQNIGFLCDSPSYIQYASGLRGNPVPITILGARTAGYPLLLLFAGVVGSAGFKSFLGILVIQAAMAVAIPLLVLKTLEPYGRRVAFFTALATIVSLQPYITSKLIMTEQSYKFFVILLVYLACGAYRSPSPRWWIGLMSATCVFLAMLRPSTNLMSVIVFAALLVSRPREWRLVVGGFAFVVAFLLIYSFAASLYLTPKGQFSAGKPSRLADLAFYDLYIHENGAGLDPGKGPARRELREVLDAFARDRPQDWVVRAPRSYFSGYAEDPSAWVENVYRKPNPFYYGALKDAVAMTASYASDPALSKKAQKLIRRVVVEAYVHEPWRIVSLLYRYGMVSSGAIAGHLMFYKVYIIDRLAKFSPENGPASTEFIRVMSTYLADFPEESSRIAPPPRYKNYYGNPDGFIDDQLLGHPNGELFFHMWEIFDVMKGPIEARKLFSAVVHEGMANGSAKGAWGVYRELALAGAQNMAVFFFGYRGLNFEHFYNTVQCYRGAQWEAKLRHGMRLLSRVEIRYDGDSRDPKWWFDDAVKDIWFVVRLACTWLIVVATVFCIRSRHSWPVFVIGALVVYHAAAACFLISPDVRYVDQIMPLVILLAGFVASALLERMRRRGIAQPPAS